MKPTVPEGFPPLTLTVMRALCALTVVDGSQDVLIKMLDELLREMWVEHRKVWEKESFGPVFQEVIGAETTAKGTFFSVFMVCAVRRAVLIWVSFVVMGMLGKEGKEVLTKNSDLALQDGAFGLPWFVATNSKGECESFWGVDHLGQVAAHLGLENPRMGGWKSML